MVISQKLLKKLISCTFGNNANVLKIRNWRSCCWSHLTLMTTCNRLILCTQNEMKLSRPQKQSTLRKVDCCSEQIFCHQKMCYWFSSCNMATDVLLTMWWHSNAVEKTSWLPCRNFVEISVEANVCEEHWCHISSRSVLKQCSLRLFCQNDVNMVPSGTLAMCAMSSHITLHSNVEVHVTGCNQSESDCDASSNFAPCVRDPVWHTCNHTLLTPIFMHSVYYYCYAGSE